MGMSLGNVGIRSAPGQTSDDERLERLHRGRAPREAGRRRGGLDATRDKSPPSSTCRFPPDSDRRQMG